MKNTVFTGAGVAIVTPMNPDMSINYKKLGELIDWQIDGGADAIIICGTTGESTTMTDDEHIDCIKFAVERTNKRVPVVAGTGSNDTAYAVMMSQEADKAGADALLVVTPYYNKTSQRGLIKHFETIVDSVSIPLILYNVPGRTGMTIAVDTYKKLSQHPNIVATKEASGDLSHIAEVIATCGDNLDVYSGVDEQIVPILSLGGKGTISVLANCMPKQTHDMCQLYFDGNVDESKVLQLELMNFINSLFMDVNPIPVKEALNIMGKNVGECRMPLLKMTDKQIDKLKYEMKKVNLI